jgi:hypothetical protein
MQDWNGCHETDVDREADVQRTVQVVVVADVGSEWHAEKGMDGNVKRL